MSRPSSPSSAMPTACMRRGCVTGRRRSAWPTTSCALMPPPPGRSAPWSTTRRSAWRSTSTRSRRRPVRSGIESRPTTWSSARDAWFLDPLFGRGYPALGLEAHREAGHLEGIDLAEPPAGDLDYLGLNYYRRDSVSARSDRAVRLGDRRRAGLGADADGLARRVRRPARHAARAQPRRTRRPRSWSPRTAPRTPTPSIRTDGCATSGRIDYLARHVAAASEALRAGVPLTGYYVWSLLDNYEWSLGYTRRFGLVHVDFDSQRRTPKDSARWYQRLVAPRASQ